MKNTKKLLSGLLLLVFLFSTGKYLLQMVDNAASGSSSEQALELATSGKTADASEETAAADSQLRPFLDPDAKEQEVYYVPQPIEPDEYIQELSQMDLDALRQVNPDVVGWILIPDTNIHYPVVQGEDNQHYLETTWDGKPNSAGAIFLECTNQKDMTEFHTILYGHNMVNRTMFAQIRNYTTQNYWQEHPYVYMITETGIYRYEIYASYEAGVDSDTYMLDMQQNRTKKKFIDYTAEQSVIDTGITPAITDRILTLSTCSGMGHTTRWVIHARLPMVEAAE